MHTTALALAALVFHLWSPDQSRAEEISCANVSIESADKCENLVVHFDIDKCEDGAVQKKTKISCAENKATATVKSTRYEYQVEIVQGAESWGVRPWQVQGPIARRELKKRKTEASQPNVISPVALPSTTKDVPSPSAPTNASVASSVVVGPVAPPATSTVAAESVSSTTPVVKVGGFVDAQYKNKKDDLIYTGFQINDGALYLSHSFQNAEVFVDLPFSWEGEKYGDTTVQVSGADVVVRDPNTKTYTNSFQFARNKAQAFVSYSVADFKFSLGQFDTIYGFELNDSPDIQYSTQGIVYNMALPLTHTGAMAAFAHGPWSIKAMAANPNNQGASGNSQDEYGGLVGFSNERVRLGLGYMYRVVAAVVDSTGTKIEGSTYRAQEEILAGFTIWRLSFDYEMDLIKTAIAPLGRAQLANLSVTLSDNFTFGARYEWVHRFGMNATTNTLIEDTHQLTVGPQYKLTPNLKAKLDMTWFEQRMTQNAVYVPVTSGAVAAVYKF